MKQFIKSFEWNWFELTLIGTVFITALYFFIVAIPGGGWILSLLDLVAAITGIFSVVLCAKGKKSGFIFGLVNVIAYSIIAFNSLYFGEVMLNVLFYVPMNIASYFLWKNNQKTDKQEVICRALNWKQIAVGIAVIAVITFLYHLVLVSLGGAMTLLDGTTTILSIVATILMATRYSEQWLCWIVTNVITVIMWVIAANPVMVVMWSAYLINAFYGYWRWRKNSK